MTCTADDDDVDADDDDHPTDMGQYSSYFWQGPVQHIYFHTFVRSYVHTFIVSTTERSLARRVRRVAKSDC